MAPDGRACFFQIVRVQHRKPLRQGLRESQLRETLLHAVAEELESSGIEVEFKHDIAGVFRGDPKPLLGGSQRILGLPAFGDVQQGGAHADCLASGVAHQDVVDFDPQLTTAAPHITALVGLQG